MLLSSAENFFEFLQVTHFPLAFGTLTHAVPLPGTLFFLLFVWLTRTQLSAEMSLPAGKPFLTPCLGLGSYMLPDIVFPSSRLACFTVIPIFFSKPTSFSNHRHYWPLSSFQSETQFIWLPTASLIPSPITAHSRYSINNSWIKCTLVY